MLKRVLVPLDGSGLAERALTYATAIAEATGAEIMLLRAASGHTLPGVDPRERNQGAIDDAQEYIDKEVARVSARTTPCSGIVRFGHAADCIAESARTRRADLIVMSTHGRTGPGRWLFGSVAEAVVAASPVPVLVQRAWQPLFGDPLLDEHPTILVPLDGSPFAESVVEAAATLAEDLNARLVLLTVRSEPSEIHTASDYLAGVQRQVVFAHPNLETATDFRYGEAAHGIEDAVAQLQAALVFMATHGRTGARRSVLGSVAGKLLQESDVPVVLLRPLPAELDDSVRTTTGAVSESR
jgi:nucleotide-binding universal stress UspA family protein